MRVSQPENFLADRRERLIGDYVSNSNYKLGPKNHGRYIVRPIPANIEFYTRIRYTMNSERSVRFDLSLPLEIDIMQRLDITLFSFIQKKRIPEHLVFVHLKKYTREDAIPVFLKKLQIMHENLYVHCDLHFNNIMCMLDEEGLITKFRVIDYGLGLFNDRLSEPRFETSYMTMLYSHNVKLSSLYLPTSNPHEFTPDMILSDVTQLDSWVVEGFKFADTFERSKMSFFQTLLGPKTQAFGSKFALTFKDEQEHQQRSLEILPPSFTLPLIPLPETAPELVIPKPKVNLANLWPFYNQTIIHLDSMQKNLTAPQIKKLMYFYQVFFGAERFKKTVDTWISNRDKKIRQSPDKLQQYHDKNDLDSLRYVVSNLQEVAHVINENAQYHEDVEYKLLKYIITPNSNLFNMPIYKKYLQFFVIDKVDELVNEVKKKQIR